MWAPNVRGALLDFKELDYVDWASK